MRPTSVCSPTAAAAAVSCSGEMVNPMFATAAEAVSTVGPRTVPGMFIAKYRPWSSTHAAASAQIATNDSMSMAPYPIIRTCDSFSMSFGVVPDATREWKPDSAPQAIVMNTNGNSDPANTGPVPLNANSVNAGVCIIGQASRIDTASRTITPIFMKLDR